MTRRGRSASIRGGPPRVLHVSASYGRAGGGIGRYVEDLATGLAAPSTGAATVLAPAATGEPTHVERAGAARVLRVARQGVVHSEPTGLIVVSLGPRLRQLAAGRDVAHAHLPFPFLLGAAACAPASLPWVVTYHNEIQDDVAIPRAVRAAHDLLLRRFLGRARMIVVTTAGYAAACHSLDPFAAKVRVVPIGIDADRFAAPILADPPRRRPDTILYVGRLAYYKGLDTLLAALAGVPEARLIVVGDGPEGGRLREVARARGVADRVEWRGHVPDAELPRLYAAAAALVLPSTGLSESFGITQLEAHACGTPVVSSRLPGVAEVNPDGVTGLQARPRDADSLARALRRLLGDEELRARLSHAAYHHVRERYARRRMLEGVARVYEEALGP